MSEGSNNASAREVEDVLSSIRKLVADEARLREQGPLESSGLEPEPLVLTSDLRIEPEPSETSGDVEEVEETQGFSEAAPEWVEPAPVLDEPAVPEEFEDAPILDELALRELVAEVVRDELQGDLGERISKNFRRMVRREINNAMNARLAPK
jgi:hypothetical protein